MQNLIHKKNQLNKILKKWRKHLEMLLFYLCIPYIKGHMMYDSWDIRHNRQKFCHFGPFFCLFTPLTSPFNMKITQVLQKVCIKIVVHAIYNYIAIFSYTYNPLFCCKIKCFCDQCLAQQIRLQTVVQLYIFHNYSSVRIGSVWITNATHCL